MTAWTAEADGRIVVDASCYRLEVDASGMRASLSSPSGAHWLTLRLLTALDTAAAPDETLAVEPPRVAGESEPRIEIARRSTVWERAALTLACGDESVELRAAVSGRGTLTEVHLLGGRSLVAGAPTGFMPSGSSFETLFTPNP